MLYDQLQFIVSISQKENAECSCRCHQSVTKRFAMPYGSAPKQKPLLPSDWTDMGMAAVHGEESPSLGPGLLPDGSTGRRQQPVNDENAFFSQFFGGANNGMPHRRRRRRRRHVISSDGIPSNGGENGVRMSCDRFYGFIYPMFPLARHTLFNTMCLHCQSRQTRQLAPIASLCTVFYFFTFGIPTGNCTN